FDLEVQRRLPVFPHGHRLERFSASKSEEELSGRQRARRFPGPITLAPERMVASRLDRLTGEGECDNHLGHVSMYPGHAGREWFVVGGSCEHVIAGGEAFDWSQACDRADRGARQEAWIDFSQIGERVSSRPGPTSGFDRFQL